MVKKIILIDGNSIINRAFYGVPDLTNSEGIHTNAIYGFLNILFKILEEEKAGYLMVAFDLKAPTFRHAIYSEYKGTRKGMPQELSQQLPILKEVLEAMGISMLSKEGFEADDILGTIARRMEPEGYEVVVVSGDRDLLQLATDHIKIRMPKTSKGKTEVEDYFAADVRDKYQIEPLQIIELKALMGDNSDNIPGVPKVGEKTATELVMTYGTIENLKKHLSEITKKSIKETLESNFELAELSKVLATIETNADIPFCVEDAAIHNIFTKEAYQYMKRLEFKNILSRFEKEVINSNEQTNYFKKVEDLGAAANVFQKAGKSKSIGFQIIVDDKMLGLSIAFSKEDVYYMPVAGFMTEQYLVDELKLLLENESIMFATYYLKQELKYLKIDQGKNIFDIQLMAYLLNPLKNDYDIEDIANEHLGLMIQGRKQLFAKMTLEQASEKEEEFLEYVCYYSYVSYSAYSVLREAITDAGMEDLLENIEMPLIYCLYRMEVAGVGVWREELAEYGKKLVGRIAELEHTIHEQAGEDFNINSPKQMGEVLFEKMMLPGGKKTKTGYSTAADVLEKLAPDFAIVSDILEYRGLAKLKSTYADGLGLCIAEDGRIHSTFNQTITATGRISSTEPNLQNIPVRMELGRLIRKVFIPKEGYVFVDADYSQIELRILAHMSGDQQLIDAYKMDQDIHRITASKVFHIPFDQVTSLQRRNAKAVNFGIVYGISSFGLSQDLSISRKEAADYIEKYFATYPDVKRFLDKLVEDAKTNGYVTTMYGRRRPVPELSSSNFMQRSFGERVAMNAPIQGTAADIMKLAMLHVDQALRHKNMKSRLILQVHDELLIEAAKDEVELVKQILVDEMKEAVTLLVPMEIDVHDGKNWYEAK